MSTETERRLSEHTISLCGDPHAFIHQTDPKTRNLVKTRSLYGFGGYFDIAISACLRCDDAAALSDLLAFGGDGLSLQTMGGSLDSICDRYNAPKCKEVLQQRKEPA